MQTSQITQDATQDAGPDAKPPKAVSIIEWFDARCELRAAFLAQHGFSGAQLHPVGEDCAFRRYFRIDSGNGKTMILMEAVPDGQAIATPGHSLHDFLRIGSALRDAGLNTPRVHHVDEAGGYILMQDFGDRSFKRAIAEGEDPKVLYGLATDVLTRLRQAGREGALADLTLPDYYKSHVHTGRRRLVDWYMPAAQGRAVEDGVADSYLAVWDKIERSLPPGPHGFLHIDFHFENLMLVGGAARGGRGLDQCGILDFQGAMHGPVPYDLANLLEDARVDVDPVLRAAMLDRFCRNMTVTERQIFLDWYRVLATQFHFRVIGQFIRLSVRDGKDRYLQNIPRLAGYIREGLRNPVLKPMAEWCRTNGLDFTKTDGFDPETIRPLIRPDAF